ncbi:hypothetical protein D7Y13_05770 [Corallococcus praedator]|uniref:Tenascin-X n=1 Tax=Corallococcus praedator TaxID=2316724 RepID=A0ABX9QQM9_9BACT|nr:MULTISPECIES: hypothetical protein [Corallococcus]RKH18775.1 hypothetical protein D7X74_08775 [Corallococcus sp. CA047B]RKH34707.1 hypothetical protein D7X75_07135 [Corallococcus sp. CA031C]RKI14602.1 hypothetical protein D7Y13_05770 [Corallococcus praedator]
MKRQSLFLALVVLPLLACGGMDMASDEGVTSAPEMGSVQSELQPNWASCSGDADCTSNRCGCNGGTARVCLPNSTYPKQCGNWTACNSDSQCTSNWCGCNGGQVKQCLPNTSYPKTCT